MRSKTTNPELIDVLKALTRTANEGDAAIWDALADKLRKSKHNRVSVNISRINRYTIEDETVVIPGKVLGSGVLTHRVNVAALSFSRQAREKVEGAGGRCLTIKALIGENPEGSGVKIVG